MTVFVFFDAYASSYEIKGEIGTASSMDGVESMTLLQKAEGDAVAAYCIEMKVTDEKTEEVMQRIKSMAAQYSGYVSNFKVMSYKQA
jgi:hypothetical protein